MRKLAVIFILFFTSISFAAADSPRYIPSTFFAMQSHSLQGDTSFHTRTCKLMAEAGIKLIRDELYWSNLEMEKGKIIFPENYIQNVEITLANGIEPLIILDYGNPNYDNGAAPYTDEGRAAFARYCAAVVSKFKGKIKYFEIWNEPNIAGFWKPEPNPKDYVLLLKVAYTACKSANPDCVILGGATSGVDLKYLESVFQKDGLKYMDILSLHPYTGVSPEENDLIGKITAAQKLTEKYGKPLRIWFTEVGYPTHIGSNGFPESTQSNYLVRTYLESLASGYVDAVFWYWFGPDGPDAAYSEDRFGIIRQDWSQKPAYAAYKTMTEQLRKAKYLGLIAGLNNSLLGCRFLVGKNQVAAIWSKKGLVNSGLSTEAKEVKVVFANDSMQSYTPWQKQVTLAFTESPVYIISRNDLVQPSSALFRFGKMQYACPPGSTRDVNILIEAKEVHPGKQVDAELSVTAISDEIQVEPNPISCNLNVPAAQFKKVRVIVPKLSTDTTVLLTAQLTIVDKLVGTINSELSVPSPLKLLIHPELDMEAQSRKVNIILQNLMDTPITGELFLSSSKDILFDRPQIRFDAISTQQERTFSSEIKESELAPDTLYPIEVKAFLNTGNIITVDKTIDYLLCKKTNHKIVIDGKLNEWNGAIPIYLNRADQIIIGKDKWKGISDCSGTIYTMWDDQNLYIAAVVLDDMKSSAIKPGSMIYHSDGIEVYFDTDIYGDEAIPKYNPDDFQYGFFDTPEGPIVWRWSPGDTQDKETKIAIVYRKDLGETKNLTGYVIEGSIPLSELKLTPKPGTMIGFTVALDDDDTPDSIDPFHQDLQMIWAGSKYNWTDPTGFGQLFFVNTD